MTTVAAPPMSTEVTTTDTGFTVRVEHHRAQSYSRAVGPRATREANRHLRAAGRTTAVLTEVQHHSGGSDRCSSTYHYRWEI